MIDADTIAAQRARLLAYLPSRGACTRAELEQACDIPSVTKRICELIAEGWPIDRTRSYVDSAHSRRRATVYRLTGPCRQPRLFE